MTKWKKFYLTLGVSEKDILSIHKELLGVDSPEDISIIEGVLRGQNN